VGNIINYKILQIERGKFEMNMCICDHVLEHLRSILMWLYVGFHNVINHPWPDFLPRKNGCHTMAHYVSHSSSQCFVQTFHKAKKIKSKMDVVFPCFSYWIQSDSGPLKHGARLFTGVQIVGVGQGGAQLTSHLRWGMDPSDPKGPKVGCLFSNHWTINSGFSH